MTSGTRSSLPVHVPGTVSERGFARNLTDAPHEQWEEYVALLVVCRWLRSLRRDRYVVMAGDVLYASRPSREEAEAVVREQYDLAKKFGLPVRVEQRVVSLAASRA